MKTRKTSWIDRLPKPIQKAIDYSVLIVVLLVIGIFLVIAVGPPKAPPPTNYIADWDGVSHITVSYDPIPKEYIVSYGACGGGSKFLRLKADQVKPKENFRGNPCPSSK